MTGEQTVLPTGIDQQLTDFHRAAQAHIDHEFVELAQLNPGVPEMSLYGYIDPTGLRSIVQKIDQAYDLADYAPLAIGDYAAQVEQRAVVGLDGCLNRFAQAGGLNNHILGAIEVLPYDGQLVRQQMDRWFARSVQADPSDSEIVAARYAFIAGHYGLKTAVPITEGRRSTSVMGDVYKAQQLYRMADLAYKASDTATIQRLLQYAERVHGTRLTVEELPSWLDVLAQQTHQRVASLTTGVKNHSKVAAQNAAELSQRAAVAGVQASQRLRSTLHENDATIRRGSIIGAVAFALTAGPIASQARAADLASEVVTPQPTTSAEEFPTIQVTTATAAPAAIKAAETPTVTVGSAEIAPVVIAEATPAPVLPTITVTDQAPVSATQVETPAPAVTPELPAVTVQPDATTPAPVVTTTPIQEAAKPALTELSPQDQIKQLITNGDIVGASNLIQKTYGDSQPVTSNHKFQDFTNTALKNFNAKLQTTKLDQASAQDVYTVLAYLDAGLSQPAVLNNLPKDVTDGELAAILNSDQLALVQKLAVAKRTELNLPENGNFAGYTDAQQQIIAILWEQIDVSLMTADELQAARQTNGLIPPVVVPPTPAAGTTTPEAPAATPPAAAEVATGEGAQGIIIDTSRVGETDWTPEQLARIQQNLSVYLDVEAKTGTPWQLIAVLHARETNLGLVNPKNGQGLFQLYNQAGQFKPGAVSQAEFERQALMVGVLIRDDYAKRGVVDGPLVASNSDKIKDTLFSYNGRSSKYAAQAAALGYNPKTQPYEGSPYVMNLADDQRNSAKNPNWHQILTDKGPLGKANQVPGAWVLFDGLTKISTTAEQRQQAAADAAAAETAKKAAEAAAAATADAQAVCDKLGVKFDGAAEGWTNGQKASVFLCELPQDMWVDNTPRKVNVEIAAKVVAIIKQAQQQGVKLTVASAYRTNDEQTALRTINDCPDISESPASTCKTPTAIPGHSNHQMGDAIDFAYDGHSIKDRSSHAYKVLAAAATANGLKNLDSEPWHWSPNGN